MWSNASASTRTSSRRSPISIRGPRSPRVDARGDVRHPPQRRGDARGDGEAARQRGERGQRAGEEELVAHGPLGAVGRRGRLPHPGPRDDAPAHPEIADEEQHAADVRAGRWTEKPGGAARKRATGAVLARLLGRALPVVGGPSPRSSGWLVTVARRRRGDTKSTWLVGRNGSWAR